MSIYDIVKNIKSRLKGVIKHKDRQEIKIVEDTYEKDNKVIISSMNDLIRTEEKIPVNESPSESIKPEIEDFVDDTRGYSYPPISLLNLPPKKNKNDNSAVIKDTINILEEVFHDFGIEGKTVAANIGPAVTQYEMEIKAGTKVQAPGNPITL